MYLIFCDVFSKFFIQISQSLSSQAGVLTNLEMAELDSALVNVPGIPLGLNQVVLTDANVSVAWYYNVCGDEIIQPATCYN